MKNVLLLGDLQALTEAALTDASLGEYPNNRAWIEAASGRIEAALRDRTVTPKERAAPLQALPPGSLVRVQALWQGW